MRKRVQRCLPTRPQSSALRGAGLVRKSLDTAGEIAPGIGACWLVVLTGGGGVNGLEATPGSVFDGGSSPKWLLEPSAAVPMDVLLVVGAMD